MVVLAGILGHSRVSDWGVWRRTPLEVSRVTNSLPCSEPLLRLASLAIAHGWGWCQAGGSQSGVSNRPVRPAYALRDGAPVRRDLSGRHVHELRVRDGALVRRGRSGQHVHELRV